MADDDDNTGALFPDPAAVEGASGHSSPKSAQSRNHPPMSPDQLRAVGEELFGRWGWQTRLAEALRVDGSTVRRWLSGATVIPGPAAVAMELLVERRRTGWDR